MIYFNRFLFFVLFSIFFDITPSPPTKYTLLTVFIFSNVTSGNLSFVVNKIGALGAHVTETVDPFYEEPVVTLQRVENKVKQIRNQK